jgi:hypothetical protein
MGDMMWTDVSDVSPRRAWQMLRSLRHEPPGRASRGDRRFTFDAALEQAEQFLAAAGGVGIATRPVLAFYGLRQAGAAIASAAVAADQKSWRLTGHGIKVVNLSDARTGSVSGLLVQDNGMGSFTQMAGLLDSASLPGPIRLSELTNLLPDTHQFSLADTTDFHPLAVDLPTNLVLGSHLTVQLFPVPLRLAMSQGGIGAESDWRSERSRIEGYLAHYPTLSGWTFLTPIGQPVGIQQVSSDSCVLPIQLPRSGDDRPPSLDVADRTNRYSRRRLAFPSIGGSSRAFHPFLAWWAVTYALSMVSRYDPKAWAARTSISNSGDAARLEHLLEQALVVLPELIYDTIRQVAVD